MGPDCAGDGVGEGVYSWWFGVFVGDAAVVMVMISVQMMVLVR